jgi:hypothetical protein
VILIHHATPTDVAYWLDRQMPTTSAAGDAETTVAEHPRSASAWAALAGRHATGHDTQHEATRARRVAS